jgi:hypothetical protein
MGKYHLHDGNAKEPFLTFEADSEKSVPTSMSVGKTHAGRGSEAEELMKADTTVVAIASRMGRDVIVKSETGDLTDEPKTLEESLAKARANNAARARRVQKDDEVSLSAEGEIVKTDPDKQIVFGWAYVAITKDGSVNYDKSGDFIDQIEEIEESAYDYVLRSRAADADHTNVKGGEMVESIVFTPDKIEKMGIPAGAVPLGWWVGYHIEDAATWERVKKGELKAFSIHGSGTRTKVDPSL